MGWVVNATPWPFTPGKDTRYPLYKRMGGPQGRSGQVRKISPPTGIRSPDRPALSESLYRLRYPGPHQNPVYVCLLPMHATCTTHTTFLDFITLIIPADESKLRSSSLCNFLSPPVPPSLPTGSKNFPQDPLFKYPQSRLFPERSRSNLISIQNNLTKNVKMLEIFLEPKMKATLLPTEVDRTRSYMNSRVYVETLFRHLHLTSHDISFLCGTK